MNKLLNTRELAEKLSVSERHVYRLKAAGKLPRPKRIGRCVRWDPKDFENWLASDGKNNKR
jgi:excisionase family DNA binding protein